MRLPPARLDWLWNAIAAPLSPHARKLLTLLATCLMWFVAAPAQAQSVTGISATPNCDAVTGVSLSSPGTVTIADANGTLIAWASTGIFIPFESPSNNVSWSVSGATPSTIVPSDFAPQCAPASLTVSPGNFNATIMRGGLGAPPNNVFSVGNAGGGTVYLAATPYFPGGVAFFTLSALPSLGPQTANNLVVTLNAAAFSLPPGAYTASIEFSNAAALSLVTTRQVHLTVMSSIAHDFNGDGFSDIAWRDNSDHSGNTSIWLENGAGLMSSGGLGPVPTNWSIVGVRDFDRDGKVDLLWRDTTGGDTLVWFMNGTQVMSSTPVGNIPIVWTVLGTCDFNGDGMGDIVWRDSSGNTSIWLMNGAAVMSAGGLGNVATNWSIVGLRDFDGDGKCDLLWRDTTSGPTSGDTSIWFMNGTQVVSSAPVGNISTIWSVAGTGDFNGDGMGDIVWRDGSGNTSIWLMNGAAVVSAGTLGNIAPNWSIVQTGDYNGDGMSDLLWRDTTGGPKSGDTSIWFINGVTVSSTAQVGNIPIAWTVQSVTAE